MRSQQIVVSRNGWIVFASGGSNWTDQIVPRHALVLRADGSAPPEIGFIGPRLGNHARFASGLRPQQIALSPDGQTLYFAGMGTEGKTPKGIHCIGKTTWDAGTDPEPFIGKPDEAGSDGEHLNAPTSVATDGTGNILVVDSGNNRIAVFDASGKYLGETAVPNPGHVCVHPTDGTMYVGSSDSPLTGKHEPAKPYSILKFDKPAGGREVARYEFGNYRYHPVIALDSSAKEPRIWLSHSPAWGQSLLVPLSDRGDKLVAGKNALDADSNVFAGPMFIAADPVNERLYVGDFSQTILKVDLKDDKVSRFTKASEAAVDREGNVYVLAGYGSNAILRYDSSGKPAPFPGSDSNKITIPYRAGLPHVGVRGLTVAPNGDIYAFEEVLKPQQLHVFGPDGQPKKSSVIKDIPKDSANSVAVDRDGNIYVGVNVHDPKALYPDELAGQIPAFGWERTYGRSSGWYSFPQRDVPPLPWSALYLNNYLYHYGNVFKFGPEGGCFWTGGKPNKGDNPRPEGVSADAVEFRTALLGNVVWASGAKWVYKGFALAASRTENSGDPTCSCMTSRFGMDEYGRLWVPDVFRFRVTALDASGNEMTRFGGYGNVDSMGSLSAGEGPAIPLCFPNAVAAAGDRLYVADRKSRRIVVVKLTSAAEETCAIK
jgi:sugar lactone lactonase YvrE